MNTAPLLLDVPKDSPTHKERIEQFKMLAGIETNHCAHEEPGMKWLAMHRPTALAIGEGYGVTKDAPMADIYAHVGRLIDECDADAYGATEREAIRNLCQKRDIPCWL